MQGDPAQVAGWADGLDLPKGGETILFCDCMAAYRQTKVPARSACCWARPGSRSG